MIGDILIKSGELYLEAEPIIKIWRREKNRRSKSTKRRERWRRNKRRMRNGGNQEKHCIPNNS